MDQWLSIVSARVTNVMKSATLFFIGTTLGLVILAVWAYLLLFGAPASVRNLVSNSGFSDLTTSEDAVPRGESTVVVSDETPTIDTDSADINQLTTRPVAGFVATTTKGNLEVYYVERGTGHIFAIDLGTGNETRLSGKTFAKVVTAEFSPNAGTVVFGLEHNNTISYVVGVVPTSEDITFEGTPLPEGSEQVSLVGGQIRYAMKQSDGLTGHRFDSKTGKHTKLFSIPLRDVRVLWSLGDTLIVPRPAPFLTGAVYRINGSALEKVTESHYALTGTINAKGTAFVGSYFDPETDAFVTEYWSRDMPSVSIPSNIIPEKCAFVGTESDRLVCASTWIPERERTYLTDWYKGIISADDQLWDIDPKERSSWLIADPEDVLGVPVDITGVAVFRPEGIALMKNKLTDALLVYYLPDDIR